MTTRPIDIVNTILGGSALAGVIYILVKESKRDKKLDEAVDRIAGGIDVNVDNELVERAVQKAVDRETSEQVDRACTRAVSAVRGEISEKVKAAVKAEEKNLKENTKKEIAKKIDGIDISEARQQVIDDAQQIVAERFEEDLAGIRETYETTIKKAADMCSDILHMANTNNQASIAKNVNDSVKTIVSIMEKV